MTWQPIAFLLLAPVLLEASAVEGTVKDPSGAIVPGATVSLKGTSSSPLRSSLTDDQGHFRFTDVSPGRYVLTVQHGSFEAITQDLEVGDSPVSLSISLKIPAQETAVEVGGKVSVLANSDPHYQALRNGTLRHSYRVKDLMLKRDAASFTFTSGTFSFLPPVLGHVTAGVFVGEGAFHLEPAVYLEKNYIGKISGQETVDEPFRSVVIWFTDATYEEVTRQAHSTDEASQGANAWQEFHGRARHRTEMPRSMLESMLQTENVVNEEAEILGELYNVNQSGSFRAFIHGNRHSDLRFLLNRQGALPFLPSPEEVALINLDPGGSQEGIWYLTHYEHEWKTGAASSMENRHSVQAEKYRIETAIGKNDHLSATCLLQFKDLLPGVRVLPLGLMPRLRVLRVTYKEREIPFIQEGRKEDGSLYVIMPDPLVEGKSYEISIEYEGNKVIEKAGSGTFWVGARESWYPSLNAFTDRALYDLTFKVPKQYTLVAVGNLEKEWKEEGYAATHWVSEVPLAVAGFNYGTFKKKSRNDDATKYQVEAYATSDAPDYLRQFSQSLSPSSMAESALVDAQNAIRCYTVWFGDAPYRRIAITQQPDFSFGQSWPTLVYLPVSAFLDSTQRWMLMGGSAFRFADFIQEVTPHEVAHQWWGHMVGWASYHDQWLSEGFADFSAGLFLQQIEQKPDKFLKFWAQAREHILEKNNFGIRAEDAGPLWMGIRLSTYKNGPAYNRLVYPKGGYILHMLRYLMYDRETGDKDFIALMHDFVQTHLHKNACTESFKSVVEKHIKPGMDLERNGRMDWFFREWVYGTEVPGYRLEYSLAQQEGGKYLFTGKVTQAGVSDNFLMAVPLYFDFDGRITRAGEIYMKGSSTSKDVKLMLPRKPKRVMLNAYHDVLATGSVAKEL
ncbi:MAG: M1 family aminopeptidase [Bryobacteraceae bacterium]